MHALDLIAHWPVEHVGAAVVVVPADGAPRVATQGDPRHSYRIASLSKPLAAWAALVALEEGLVTLDQPIGQPGCTLRHLLAHAGGYSFDGPEPVAAPGTRRIYSNTGIELAAAAVAAAAEMPFAQYLAEAVFQPLGMTDSELRGSPAHQVWSTVADLVCFAQEQIRPTLLAPATVELATTPTFTDLRGVVPGLGSYPRCSWGLGVEIHGDKQPHWMGTRNSPRAFGHFGGSGTMMWVDPAAVPGCAVAAKPHTDRTIGDRDDDALRLWPAFSDAVVDEVGAA